MIYIYIIMKFYRIKKYIFAFFSFSSLYIDLFQYFLRERFLHDYLV